MPVPYQNRSAGKHRDESLAGWYYLAVKLGATREGGDTNAVPVRIDLTVTGTTEPGPRYTHTTEVFGGASATPSPTGSAAPRAAADSGPLTTAAWIVVPTLLVAGALTTLTITLLRRRRTGRLP